MAFTVTDAARLSLSPAPRRAHQRRGRLRLTLRTARSLPRKGPSTLGFDPTRFQTEPPACYRASWQLPGPDSHRQATTSLRTMVTYIRSPPVPLGARKIEVNGGIELHRGIRWFQGDLR